MFFRKFFSWRKFCQLSIVNCQLLIVVLSASAQTFTASAPKSVPENQNFNLSFTLKNANGANVSLPPMNDFQLMGGPSTMSSFSNINGAMSQSMTYTYVLRPKRQGTFTIGKASINVNGTTIQSNEVSVTVTAPVSQQQQQQSQNQNNPFNDPFFNDPFGQQQQPQVSEEELKKQIKDDVFVRVVLNKTSTYKGELVTATYRLYYRRNIVNYNLSKSPSFDGFWTQEVELDPKRRPTVETYNGKQYNTLDLIKYHLYSQRSGSLEISPIEINAVAQVSLQSRSNNLFDNFFGHSQNVSLTLKTLSAKVNVKDLPESGKPENFSGAVGTFGFSTSLSGKEAKTDDALTYTMKISGTGNLKLLDAPEIQFPSSFESYDPKEKENITNSADGLSGTLQYDYLLIPHEPGEFKIPSYTFSYFDPATAKYTTIASPEYPLKITGQPTKNSTNNSSSNQKDISLLNEDIRYIKTQTPSFEKENNSFFGSLGFYAMSVAPLFLFIGLIALKKRNENLAADVIGTKRKKALSLARKRLSKGEKFLKQNDRKNFYEEVSRAMWGYVCDKLNIDIASLSKENVEEKLLSRNVSNDTIARLLSIINSCELALYSPAASDTEMKNNYSAALNLIADLENEIKK
ncbi:MAG TPA: hypothetical protein DCQ93_08435 [Bacteroidetes bacterium]|nr:hypothetical protein [Bacteroidota bacterium]